MDLGRALPNRKGSWEEAGIQAEVCGTGSSRRVEKVRGAHMAKKRGGIDGKDVQSAVCMSSDASRNSCIDYVTDYINNVHRCTLCYPKRPRHRKLQCCICPHTHSPRS